MSFDVKYDDRLQKIREAGAAAIRQLDKLRSTGPTPRETLDAEVARIAQEKRHPYGCDFVVRRTDGVARFVIRVRRTGRSYDLIERFFYRDNGR
ncbi:MAG: hypothetical protein WA849_09610 [Candidatus Udaeobacter sp.]